ncbi:MAG: RAD55 family ATPase, partial [Polyangiales bacterium]
MDRVNIRKLPTSVQGLDKVLGGGLPEFSFNLIAGGPGCGKTTLAHQIMFANASEDKPAVYFTIFGEPPLKMLRYQQQFRFFDSSKINRVIRFVHLGQEMLDGGLAKVLESITRELESTDARIVVVDSFRSGVRTSGGQEFDPMGIERFVQTLALKLTSHEATTFLVGEYLEQESHSNPVFTVCDGLFWLHQSVVRNSVVRRIQIVKVRGADPAPGLHTVKLTDEGMRIYPRVLQSEPGLPERTRTPEKDKKTGVPGLDEMLGGGIPAGYSILVAGPSGSGKTMLATQFLLAGAQEHEPAVIAFFEKHPQECAANKSPRQAIDHIVRDENFA